jgi:fatty-acyl-CoA synthase
MTGRLIQAASSAYQFPLILKHIWNTPLLQARDQEVVYRDAKRFTYAQIWERINRLASALAAIGVHPGDTVGVLDWDSNRFLEAFFAIPMMGAVMQTVNVRVDDASCQRRICRTGQGTQAAIAKSQAARRDVGSVFSGNGRPIVCRRI